MLAEKWKCKHSSDILGNEITVNEIRTELHNGSNHTWLIFGGTGSGKSKMISCILNEHGYTTTVFDASFKRSVKSIKSKAEEVIKHSHFCKTAIVFDEFEHVVEENFGAVVLIDFIKTLTQVPVFVIMNTMVKLRVLKFCTKFEYQVFDMCTPDENILLNSIQKFVKKEKIKIKKRAILERIHIFQTDIRKLINSLEFPLQPESSTNTFSKFDNLFSVNYVLENQSNTDKNIKVVESDIFASVPILHENYPSIAKSCKHAMISKLLSECDIFHTYIYSTQAWELLYMCAICGVLIPCLVAEKKHVSKYGTILSRISNAQTKDKAVKLLFSSLNVTTLPQIGACKLLQNKLNISKKLTTTLNNVVKF